MKASWPAASERPAPRRRCCCRPLPTRSRYGNPEISGARPTYLPARPAADASPAHSVGNALRGVPRMRAPRRNASGMPRRAFPTEPARPSTKAVRAPLIARHVPAPRQRRARREKGGAPRFSLHRTQGRACPRKPGRAPLIELPGRPAARPPQTAAWLRRPGKAAPRTRQPASSEFLDAFLTHSSGDRHERDTL